MRKGTTISTVDDRFQITEVLNRHQVAIDERDGDGYAQLFAPDGSFDSPFGNAQGRDQLKEMTLGLHEAGFTAGKRHFLGPVAIEVDGDEATALSYWWVAETRHPKGVYSTGTYRDRLKKIDGEWKIARRTQTIDPDTSGEAAEA